LVVPLEPTAPETRNDHGAGQSDDARRECHEGGDNRQRRRQEQRGPHAAEAHGVVAGAAVNEGEKSASDHAISMVLTN
jgi:hypothetical protein